MPQKILLKFSYYLRARFPFIIDILLALPSRFVFYSRNQRFRKKPMKEIFQDIYSNNLWGHHESLSGFGSSLTATQNIVLQMPLIVKEYDIKAILDIPCGDFNWMKVVEMKLERYIGADLIEDLIEKNQKQYGDAIHHFETMDILQDPLPKVDLILCRDLFIHFPDALIFQAMDNIKKSSSKYLLVFRPKRMIPIRRI